MTNKIALVDSRATENFLDESVWKELQIGHIWFLRPLIIHNVDGTENQQGKVEYFCWIKIYYLNQITKMKFFLTNLKKDCFILGYPFLFSFNLEIDWHAA